MRDLVTRSQFALIVVALVRFGAAIWMLDLYRRLRKKSVAMLGAGLSAYALAPTMVVLGGSGLGALMFALQSIATVLIVCGVLGHVVSLRTSSVVVVTALAVVTSFASAALVPDVQRLADSVFVVSLLAAAGLLVWKRAEYRRAAGSSYEWGLALSIVSAAAYSFSLFVLDGTAGTAVGDLLGIAVSAAIGLYLLNLEFTVSYIEKGRSEGRYRTLFESAGESILISGFDGRILDVNRIAAERLGYTREQLREMHLSAIDANDDFEAVAERTSAIRSQGSQVFETVHRRRDGTEMPVEVNAVMFEWEGQPAILGIARDLTERKRTEQTIMQMAYYDPLTKLANRTLFNDRLAVATAHSDRTQEGLALLFIDLDHFKLINDSLGHPVADELLIAVGERLVSVVREGDTVSRFGGDEYTMLLPDVRTREAASAVAWKILDAFKTPFELDGAHNVHITPSIGIALGGGGGQPAHELIRNADNAMFSAKEAGRNTYQFYDPGVDAAAIKSYELKNELRTALEDHELEIHYQPQVRIEDGHIVGAEALLRWKNPARGNVPPSIFVPLAEESGLIVQIGRWVLGEACRAAKQWGDAGFEGIRVGVNLSGRQLIDDDIHAYVSMLLDECHLDPELLELEITESVAMEHSAPVVKMFKLIGEMGVRVAIDDFGTGYSSLDRLKQLPINTLKVAQPFVEDLEGGHDSAAIVTTIIVLGRNLGLNVIAEGVETAGQLRMLREHECDEMQGFLFSPAVTNDEFIDLLELQTV